LSFQVSKPVQPFIIERKLHVSKILSFDVLKGDWLTYSISADASISRSQSQSDSYGWGVSPTDFLGKIPFVRDLLTGFDFKVGRTIGKHQNMSQSSGIGSSINLATESTPAWIRL
jgi:hypothetical protein